MVLTSIVWLWNESFCSDFQHCEVTCFARFRTIFKHCGSSLLRSHHQIFFSSGSSSGHGAFWIRMRWCRCFWSPSSLTKQWSSSFGFNTWVFCRFWASWPFLKFTCKPLVGNYGTSHTRTFNCDKNLEIAFEIKIEILRVYLAQISRLERAQPTKRKLESSPENLGQRISFYWQQTPVWIIISKKFPYLHWLFVCNKR